MNEYKGICDLIYTIFKLMIVKMFQNQNYIFP